MELSHAVVTGCYPEWDAPLRQAIEQARAPRGSEVPSLLAFGEKISREYAVQVDVKPRLSSTHQARGRHQIEPPDRLADVLRPQPQPVLRVDPEVVLRSVQRPSAHVDAVPLPPRELDRK